MPTNSSALLLLILSVLLIYPLDCKLGTARNRQALHSQSGQKLFRFPSFPPGGRVDYIMDPSAAAGVPQAAAVGPARSGEPLGEQLYVPANIKNNCDVMNFK